MELPLLNRTLVPRDPLPERILQFGEGNFLRGFFDWMVHVMNREAGFDTGIVLVQPRPGGYAYKFNDQDGLYTLFLTGNDNGKPLRKAELISSIQRGINPYTDFADLLALAQSETLKVVVSNTTEAGVFFEPEDTFGDQCPVSFPGKLARVLYERYLHFNGDPGRGLVIMPFELLEDNADYLKGILVQYADHWSLPGEFIAWMDEACRFCNTLVDRIVPGLYGKRRQEAWAELGYRDEILTEGESFHFLAIESDRSLLDILPFHKTDLNVLLTRNLKPYRDRKVRILNGAHTAMVPVGLLAGESTVLDVFRSKPLEKFVCELVMQEILPALPGDRKDLETYAGSILARFTNPYIKHRLLDIALNSTSKYVVRLLPNIRYYASKEKDLPERTVFALAALFVLYRHTLPGSEIPLKDDPEAIRCFREAWTSFEEGKSSLRHLVQDLLGQSTLWGEDLTIVPGLADRIEEILSMILEEGVMTALSKCIHKTSEKN